MVYDMNAQSNVVELTLEKVPGGPLLGLKFENWLSGRIQTVLPDGLVERWNESQPESEITRGCEILSVNGLGAPDFKEILKNGGALHMRVQLPSSCKDHSPSLASLSTCDEERPRLSLPLGKVADDPEEVPDSLSLLHVAVGCVSAFACALTQPRLRWNSPSSSAFVARTTQAMLSARGKAASDFGSVPVDDTLQISSDLYEQLLEGARRAKLRGKHQLRDGRLLLSNGETEPEPQTLVYF